MSEHRLIIWEAKFDKFVKDYEGDGEWSPSYLKREDMWKPDMAENRYECTCGKSFGTDEDAAKQHVREENET